MSMVSRALCAPNFLNRTERWVTYTRFRAKPKKELRSCTKAVFSSAQSLDFGWNWKWCDWKVVCVWKVDVMKNNWSLNSNFRSKHSHISVRNPPGRVPTVTAAERSALLGSEPSRGGRGNRRGEATERRDALPCPRARAAVPYAPTNESATHARASGEPTQTDQTNEPTRVDTLHPLGDGKSLARPCQIANAAPMSSLVSHGWHWQRRHPAARHDLLEIRKKRKSVQRRSVTEIEFRFCRHKSSLITVSLLALKVSFRFVQDCLICHRACKH